MAIFFFKINDAGGGGAGVVTLDNGLTLTGTNGQLGGSLLHQTSIDTNDNDFHLFDTYPDNSQLSLDLIAEETLAINALGAGGNQAFAGVVFATPLQFFDATAQLKVIPAVGTLQPQFNATFNNGPFALLEMCLYDTVAGYRKTIRMDAAPGSGIWVEDQDDGIGLIGQVVFAISDNKQYIQAQHLPNIAVPVVNVSQGSTLVVPINTATAANKLVRVNVSVLFDNFVAGSTLTCSISYTDVLGNARNAPLGVINSVIPSAFQPIVLAVAAFDDIDLSVVAVLVGGATFNAYGTTDVLGEIP